MLELVIGMTVALFGSWTFLVIAKNTPTFSLESGTSVGALPIALLFRAIAGPGLLVILLTRGELGDGRPMLAIGWALAAATWAHTSGTLLLAVA